MLTFTVFFIGQDLAGKFYKTETRLEKIILQLLISSVHIRFLINKNDDLNLLALSALEKAAKVFSDSSYSLEVFSHAGESPSENDIYAAIDRSDLLICCIENNKGKAYKAARYAKKQGKHIVNLAQDSFKL